MKINNIEITKKDFIDLANTIKNTRKWLAEGEVAKADFMLESVESHLINNLIADNLVENI